MRRVFTCLIAACATVVFLLASTAAQDGSKERLGAQLEERRVAYRDALSMVVEVKRRRFQDGVEKIDELLKAQIALGEAELVVSTDPGERIEKLKANLDVLRRFEDTWKGRINAGMSGAGEMHKSTAGRIRGEIMLLEEQQRQSK